LPGIAVTAFTAADSAVCHLHVPVLTDSSFDMQGTAADWARAKLESGELEKTGKLKRINTTQQDPSEVLKSCSKLVTAVGFERNLLPDIKVEGKQVKDIQHDKHTGTIIPDKLFGFGIAFPEQVIDAEFGHKEPNVGLWKFMRFARRVLMSEQPQIRTHGQSGRL